MTWIKKVGNILIFLIYINISILWFIEPKFFTWHILALPFTAILGSILWDKQKPKEE